jgi:hypothetical protein
MNFVANGNRLIEFVHPTLRQRREGWGTRFVLVVRRRTRTTADPYGMTTRKATAKAKATATTKATAGPSTSLRMTGFGDRIDMTENSRFLRCAAHDETVSRFGRNDDLFRVGALGGAELDGTHPAA